MSVTDIRPSWLLLAAVSVLTFTLCTSPTAVKTSEKINGVSLVSPPEQVSAAVFEPLTHLRANWVAVIPFAFSRKGEPHVSFNHERQWWGERTDGTCELIRNANRYEINILLKPHVWVLGQGWPGEYDLDGEEKWKTWERDYRQYILTYAGIADSLAVDMFAVGTEYRIAAVKREAFWRSLIKEVRGIYGGKVIYASNWDNYEKIAFWNELDYIGIDAYFPLSDEPDPSVEQLEEGWSTTFADLGDFSRRHEKPILFTEYGYRSVTGTAGRHWEINQTRRAVNMEVQANAYQAVFNKFWDRDWFAGGFLWKWHLKEHHGGVDNPHFTPQGKPAEEVIRAHFSRY